MNVMQWATFSPSSVTTKKKQQKQLTNHIKYDPNMTKIHRNNIVKWFLRFQVRVWCIVSAVRFRD